MRTALLMVARDVTPEVLGKDVRRVAHALNSERQLVVVAPETSLAALLHATGTNIYVHACRCEPGDCGARRRNLGARFAFDTLGSDLVHWLAANLRLPRDYFQLAEASYRNTFSDPLSEGALLPRPFYPRQGPRRLTTLATREISTVFRQFPVASVLKILDHSVATHLLATEVLERDEKTPSALGSILRQGAMEFLTRVTWRSFSHPRKANCWAELSRVRAVTPQPTFAMTFSRDAFFAVQGFDLRFRCSDYDIVDFQRSLLRLNRPTRRGDNLIAYTELVGEATALQSPETLGFSRTMSMVKLGFSSPRTTLYELSQLLWFLPIAVLRSTSAQRHRNLLRYALGIALGCRQIGRDLKALLVQGTPTNHSL